MKPTKVRKVQIRFNRLRKPVSEISDRRERGDPQAETAGR